MIQKHGLFLNPEAHQYEIVGLRKIRRDYVPTDEVEPLPFLTLGNLIVLGIDKREALPVPEEFDGTIQKVTSLDLSRLRKENGANEPKKWEPLLQEFIERQTRYVRDMERTQFNFNYQSLAEHLMVQKRPALTWDDPLFPDGEIIYPLSSDDIDYGFIVLDFPARMFRYVESKKGEEWMAEIELGVGTFGRFRHLKWPKPTADGQKRIDQYLSRV